MSERTNERVEPPEGDRQGGMKKESEIPSLTRGPRTQILEIHRIDRQDLRYGRESGNNTLKRGAGG
jgi:hypothetical protein